MISDKGRYNFKRLAGLLNEELKLIPDPSGRSDRNTLSFYVEEYILNLSTNLITQIDNVMNQNGYVVSISQSSTKMQENSLATKIIISSNQAQAQSKEFLFTALVNFDESSNTAISISHNSLTQQFNLNTRHLANDIALLSQEVVTHILNQLKSNSN
jgi:hypothetical protein